MHKYLDAISLAALAVLLAFTGFALYGPDRLPDRIPTHFDQLGRADAWTAPSSFEVLPVIAVIVYLALSVVTAFSWLAKNAAQKNPDGVPGLEAIFLKLITWIKARVNRSLCLHPDLFNSGGAAPGAGIFVARLVDTADSALSDDCVVRCTYVSGRNVKRIAH